MPSLADVYLQVQGDWTRLHAETTAEAAKLAKTDFKVKPRLDTTSFQAQLQVFRIRFLRDQTFTVRPVLAGGFTSGTFEDRSFKVIPLLDTTIFRKQMALFRTMFLRDQTFTITPVAATAAAAARIAALQAQVAALGAMSPTIRINTSGISGFGNAIGSTSNRMQRLITLIAIFGSSVVPIAAAATGGIFAIGAAAVAAGAGMGVLALAMIGVVGAVKALSAARDAAAKANATAVRQDAQMATAADGLRTALATLANTRASAAASAVSASRAIADAERALGAAQRAALSAQQDVTRARVEAKQALEDLGSTLKNNALSLRQANLDLAAAKRELDRVMSDPSATKEQREQAQITYDRAVQQIDDLTVRQGRLQAEQIESTRVGVEGSDQVRSAVNRLSEAREAEAAAEANVADARRAAADQQRQNAFAIEQALQAVTAAQRSLATAAVTTSSTAGAAMDELSRKMADLSREGQQFTLFVFGLRQEFMQLRQAAEAGFLPGFESGIRRLLPFMPQLIDFVSRVAAGLGDIADRSFASLASSSWRPFFSYLSGTAVPTLHEMAETFGDIVLGLANMVLAFAPVQRQVGGGFADMAEDFADWSRTLRSNRDFQEFLDYVITRGPMVMSTLGALVGALVRIATAAAPVGDVALAALTALSNVIKAIPVPMLTALVLAFGAMRLATMLAAIPLATFGATLSTLPGRLIAMTTSMGAARAGVAGFAAALGGPWMLAIAAAAIAIGMFVSRSSKAKAEIDALKTAMLSYAQALEGGFTAESAKATQAILAQDNKMRALLQTMAGLNIGQDRLLAGLRGDRDARNEVVGALDKEIDRLKQYLQQSKFAADANSDEREAAKRRVAELEKQRDAFKATNEAQAESNELTRKATEEAEELAKAGGMLNVVQRAVADAHRVLSDSMATAEQKTNALRVANDALHEAAITQIEGQERYARALIAATEALTENGTHLDFNTLQALNNRDALEEVIRASGDMFEADIAAGVGLDIATEKHKKRIEALVREALKTGANEQEVRDLIATYDRVPGLVNTDVQTKGLDQVFKDLVNLAVAQRALQEGISPADAWNKYGGLYTTAHMRPLSERALRAGGPVTGPGGPTDDAIPAVLFSGGRVQPYRLSNGEFVHNAAAVDFYGRGAMDAINEMKVPRDVLRARGGTVDWPYPLDVTRTLRPDINWVISQNLGPAGAGPGFGSWPSSPGAQRGDSGVWRSIVALIRSTGPLSGSFGNAYRPGDPLWHGSGRAVDWMGFNQDALASFFMNMRGRVLELIHRTGRRDYAVTRGRDRGSFNQTLMNQHRNHIHIAMAEGGEILGRVMDGGGWMMPGWNPPTWNGTGAPELVLPSGATVRLDRETIMELATAIAAALTGGMLSARRLGRQYA